MCEGACKLHFVSSFPTARARRAAEEVNAARGRLPFGPTGATMGRMKFFLRMAALVAGVILAAGVVLGADTGLLASKPEVRREIIAVVEAQLAAFRAGDIRKAHGYASAALRAQKPINIFAAIVRENYPEIWTNQRAEFGLVRDDGRESTLLVHVFGKDGDAAYDYTLVKEAKAWRIAAVQRHAPKRNDKI